MKYRVLRIANRLNLGGPTYNIGHLTAGLSDQFETRLIAGMKDDSEESSDFILDKLGVQASYISEMRREINLLQDYKAYKAIQREIEAFKPHIVHTHAAKAGALGRYAAHEAGVPLIYHTFHGHVFHSYFGKWKTEFFLRIERYLADISTSIIAISPRQEGELTYDFKIASKSKIEVIPLGFDLLRFTTDRAAKRMQFRNEFDLQEGDFAIGIIGRLVPVKNHRLFLKALKIVLKRADRPVKAFIIGDGEERENIEELASRLEIAWGSTENENHLFFTSWIKDIDRALAGLDMVCLTSLNEGTPVSLIEAQASGVPVVTTDAGGARDTIVNGETGILVNSWEPDHFADEMLKLMRNDDLRKEMSMKGPDFALKRFGSGRLVAETEALYLRDLENLNLT